MSRYFALVLFFILFCPGIPRAAQPPVLTQKVEKVTSSAVETHLPKLTEVTRFTGRIQLCGETIPYEKLQIRERLEKEMMLSVWRRPQVVLWLKRAHRYFPHIERILKKENLPDDLKYVPIVESALLPHSRSGKAAVGYWQFLKSTGKRYGLKINHRVDQRKNLFKATEAACRYLKALHTQFGSYLLALAAYNMGEYGLEQAINTQETKDFFDLYLPLETQRYLLKIVVAKLIIEHPDAYGFNLTPQDLYPVFTYSQLNFKLKREVPLTLIAKSAGISFKTLKDYNPDIRGYYLQDGATSLMVPKGKEKGFEKKFSKRYKAWKSRNVAKTHVVRPGESLSGIAAKHDMPLSTLLRLNHFSRKKVIHPGDRLKVR